MKTLGLILLPFFANPFVIFGQGSFQNLNFESSTVPGSQPPSTYNNQSSWVNTGAAMPSWTAFVGTNQQNSIMYNNQTIGTASISLVGIGSVGQQPLDGNFGVLLQAGLYNFNRTAVSVRQTGLVPVDAQSLRFMAFLPDITASRPFEVTLGGQLLALLPITSTSDYTLYGADISQFANQSRELRFTAFTFDGGLNNASIDSIFFSNQGIPEPSTVSLFAVGALLLGWRRQRKKSQP